MSFEGSSGGVCAVHTTIPATSTCSRCGNYMCDGCRGLGREDVCDACEAVIGSFPLTRDGFDATQALSYVWSRYKAEWVLPTMLSLLFFGVNMVISFVGNMFAVWFTSPDSIVPGLLASSLVQLIGAVIQGVILAGIFRVAVVALQGQIPTVEHVAEGMRRSGTLVVLQLGGFIIGSAFGIPLGVALESGAISPSDTSALCAVAGGMLLLMPVFIYVGLGIQNVGVETLIDPDVDIVESFKRSWAVADGARGDLFVSGLVGGFVMLGGLVACCVGIVPAAGVAMYLTTATYLALRQGMVPPPTRRFEG